MTDKRLKTLIIDDARLARKELQHLLSEYPELQVIGEAANGPEALEAIKSKQPDLLFLDIQMPGMNGFELLQKLDQVPQVIFVTAYDQYAIQAFRHNALDYLQKPVEPNDLKRAISKLTQTKSQTPSQQSTLGAGDRVFVKDGEQCWFVNITDIRLLSVDGNYTTVHFEHHRPMIPKTLNHLAQRLDPLIFFRANRNQIINLNHIKNIEPWIQGIRITLSGGEHIELSRRQTQRFKEQMSL